MTDVKELDEWFEEDYVYMGEERGFIRLKHACVCVLKDVINAMDHTEKYPDEDIRNYLNDRIKEKENGNE